MRILEKVQVRRALVVSGLSTLAVAWPLLDVYGRNPEVFVANRTSPIQMVVFALVVVLVVPLLGIFVVTAMSALSERAGRITYGVIVGLLAAAVGLVVARQLTEATPVTVLIVAAVVGLLVVVNRWAAGVLVLSALALPLAWLVFVVSSPASALIWDAGDTVEESGQVGLAAPILFVQLDELPLASLMTLDGEINHDLFPSFARLAAEGTWYRNALGDSIATTQAIPAILTGRRVERGLSPSSIDHPDNLFTLLAVDYEMQVIEWVAAMCPEEVCPDFAGRAAARFGSLVADAGIVYLHLAAPPVAQEMLPSIDNSWRGFLGQGEPIAGGNIAIDDLPVPGANSRADWVDWLQMTANGVGRVDRPVLSYVHVPSPHVPWRTNPTGTHYQRPEQYTEVEGVGGSGRWPADQSFGVLGFQRHLYQLGLLDRMLGRIFTEMDKARVWQRSMVIVVADHGASFEAGEHRRWPHEENRDDLYRVPLFIKYPGQIDGEIVDEPAFGIDVMPTIVDALRIRTPWEFDGMSLLDVGGVVREHQPIWWCCSRDPASTDLEALYAQVERNWQWVPDQSSWLGVAGVGPHAGLIGSSVDDLDVVSSDEVAWQLGLGSELVEGDRPPGMTQTYLNGRVVLPEGTDPGYLLLTVNGRVAGMALVVRDGPEGGTWHGMIAEELVSRGPNQVGALVPGPDGTWLSGATDDLALELVTADGRVLEITPEGARRLQVDRAELDAGVWTIVGWSADIVDKIPPHTIHVYAGELLLADGPPNLDNRNVVVWFDSEDLLRSGFSFEVPASEIPEGTAQLTVVAEFETHAVSDPVRLDR